MQNDIFEKEILCLKNSQPLPKGSKLLLLNPYLDLEGVLRVSGSLDKANLSMDEKHPIILPPKSKFVELIIWDAHYRVFHSAVAHTLVQIREKFDL